MIITKASCALLLLVIVGVARSWTNPSLVVRRRCRTVSPDYQSTILWSSSPQDEDESVVVEAADVSSQVKKEVVELVEEEEGTTQYPIDLPSPILLSTSMVLAIASTGSLFELLGGNPSLPFEATAAIVLIGFPLCIFLFYASILKATAETEADDREFLKRGNNKF